jgi:hypothetical protein
MPGTKSFMQRLFILVSNISACHPSICKQPLKEQKPQEGRMAEA